MEGGGAGHIVSQLSNTKRIKKSKQATTARSKIAPLENKRHDRKMSLKHDFVRVA